MQDIAKNIRSHERRALRVVCACRLPGGLITEAELTDITSRGTKAKFQAVRAQFGDRVELLINDLETISGTVRRADAEVAGIEFDRETGEHIIERLLFENPVRES